jgi:hypothetical protein
MYRIHKEGKKLLFLSAALFSLIFAGLTLLLPNYPGVAMGVGGFELFIFLIFLQERSILQI